MPTTLDVPHSSDKYPHAYSGEMQKVTFVDAFTFTHPDHVRETFPRGTYEVPIEVAEHWFARSFTESPPDNLAAPGTAVFNQRAREENLAVAQKATAASTAALKAANDKARDAMKAELKAEMQAEFDAKLKTAVDQAKADAAPKPAPAPEKK